MKVESGKKQPIKQLTARRLQMNILSLHVFATLLTDKYIIIRHFRVSGMDLREGPGKDV